jgi:outer membrane protein TolC
VSAPYRSRPNGVNTRTAMRRSQIFAAFAVTLALTACKTFSSDGGMGMVANITAPALHQDVIAIRTQNEADAARGRVSQLLKRPLSADAAVQIALLNNRSLQAAYNELGIAEAVSVRQSLPPNPSASISRTSGSVETEIDRQIIGSILALATLPARSEIAADRFRQAQLNAALETLRVAADTRRAYYSAVGAQELAGFLSQAESAAATSAQLAKRLGETGAINKLDQTREQAFQAEVSIQLTRAHQRAATERERLIRLLGLWGDDLEFTLPKALPALPRRAPVLKSVEQAALRRRVDLQFARIELETLAKSYGLTQATRFINVLDAGYADKITKDKETGEHIRDRGFTVTFEIPIFDFGEVRVREAEQIYMQSVNRLTAKVINARSEARQAHRAYRSSYDIATRYQRVVLPLRKTISEEMMLHYGAMQIDVFSLLNDARQRLAANVAAAEAKRDFWIASVDLFAAVNGGESDGVQTASVAMPSADTANNH